MDDKALLRNALELEKALWDTGIAYGNPPRLWRISPNWYYLWEKQWGQIQEFGRLLPSLRRAIDGDDSATYLRADFTLDRRGDLVLLELNGTPVGDFGSQSLRQVYHSVVGLPEGHRDPFPGAAKEIAVLLKRKFGSRRIVILLSPDRLNYRAEYSRLADYLVSQGLSCRLTCEAGNIRAGDVVYRTFTSGWLDREDFNGATDLKRLLSLGEVSIWPAFTHLEDKLWMTYLSARMSDNRGTYGLEGGLRSSLASVIPWTWPVDPRLKVSIGKRSLPWVAEELMGAGLADWSGVLKKARGAQGKGVAFSRHLPLLEWRQRLLEALIAVDGAGPIYVLQQEVDTLRHKALCLNEGKDGLVKVLDLRVRLCVAYLVEGETATVIDVDATLRDHPLVHGSSDAVIVPVALRTARVGAREIV